MRYEVFGIGKNGGYLSEYPAFNSLKKAALFGHSEVRESEFMILEKQRMHSIPISATFGKGGVLYKTVSFLTGVDPSQSRKKFLSVYK